MTTFPAAVRTPAPTGRIGRHSRRRVAAALCALALLLVGVVLIWAGATQRREGGFFSTAAAQLDTPTTALVTAEVDVAAAGAR